MKVLVTGATGFIGGAAVRALLARGDQVVAFTRRAQRAAALAAQGAEVEEGDIADPRAVGRAMAGCQAVVHAAGVPRPASWRTFRRAHVEGTRTVGAAAQQAGVRRLVHLASQAVLFAGRDLLDADDSQPYPDRYIDPYSQTKAEGERVALGFDHRAAPDGLWVCSLRPATVWGRGDTTILPIMARLARGPVGIPRAGRGDNLEATTHIANLTDAILAALTVPPAAPPVVRGDSPSPGGRQSPPCGQAYLIVDDFRITWREFLARQLEAAGVRPRFFPVPRGLAEAGAWLLDHAAGGLGLTVPLAHLGVRLAVTSRTYHTSRAKDELGWRPRMGLEEGLADLGAWVRELGGPEQLVRLAGLGGAPR